MVDDKLSMQATVPNDAYIREDPISRTSLKGEGDQEIRYVLEALGVESKATSSGPTTADATKLANPKVVPTTTTAAAAASTTPKVIAPTNSATIKVALNKSTPSDEGQRWATIGKTGTNPAPIQNTTAAATPAANRWASI